VDEDEVDYIGEWLTGIGFFEVHFPKQTTRELTPGERAHFKGMKFGVRGAAVTITFPEVENP
jgi:hypothetical protein